MNLSRKRESEKREPLEAVLPTASLVPNRGRWSTAFLMAGSALLGATAVALWNRRAIASMRIQIMAEAAKPQSHPNLNEEIF